MFEDNHHALSGEPWVAQSPRALSGIARRTIVFRREAVTRCHAQLVGDWASRDTGSLPTRVEAERQVDAELEVLCRALGRWAAVDLAEVLPSMPRIAPRLEDRFE